MDNWSLKAPKLLVREPQSESDIAENQIKVKVTYALVSYYDAGTYMGRDDVAYPVTLGRFATGIVTEVGSAVVGVKTSATTPNNVYLEGVRGCGKCIACRRGRPEECVDPQIAGKDTDGYFRDIVVCDPRDVVPLPDDMDSVDAVCIEQIAVAERAFDGMNLSAGSKVAILGGGLLGMIMAQVAQYHKYIPIIVDFSQENIDLARRCGVYYTFLADSDLQDKIEEATVGQLCDGVVHILSGKLNPLIAARIVANNHSVAFVGFSVPSMTFDMREFIERGINVFSVTNGNGYIESAINILANKAVNLELFSKEIVTDADISSILISKAEDSIPSNKLTILKMI